MLEDQDIQKIIAVVATKEDVKEMKEELRSLREIVQALTLSVDKLVKAITDMKTEYTVMSGQLSRHEKWILQLAEKLGLNLEY